MEHPVLENIKYLPFHNFYVWYAIPDQIILPLASVSGVRFVMMLIKAFHHFLCEIPSNGRHVKRRVPIWAHLMSVTRYFLAYKSIDIIAVATPSKWIHTIHHRRMTGINGNNEMAGFIHAVSTIAPCTL